MKLTNKELKEYLNMFEEDAVVCIIPVTLEDRKVYKPQEMLMIEPEKMDSPSLVVRLGRARNMGESRDYCWLVTARVCNKERGTGNRRKRNE